jgi:hypothetical protein
MSTGGIFKLITNDGVQDKLLTATAVLKRRVELIKRANCVIAQQNPNPNLNPYESWTPSLNQIEKTHNIFVNGSFKPFVAMGYEYSKVQSNSKQLGSTVGFKIPQFGDFFNDMVVHIKLSNLKSVNAGDKVRYVSFLGHKLIKHAQFKISTNIIDRITSDEYNAFYNYKVPPQKKIGYLRNIGQEIPTLGYVTSNPLTDENREYRWFGDGPQTFKAEHESVDLWIPMLFWFRETKHAVPNLVIPFQSDVRLELKLAPVNELVAFANYVGDGSFTGPAVAECELYTNHIFMLPFLQEIFVKNFGFSLIRVHKKQTNIISKSEGSKVLNSLKWPIETLYIAFRPAANKDLSQYWHKNSVLTQTDIPVPVASATTVSINQVRLQKESPSVDTLELLAHGIQICKKTTASFYNSYMSYRFGKDINTPEDPGWYMMNFNFNPGENDPSGHINVSKAREFYLNWTSTYIGGGNDVELIVLADALNFLLVKDGSGILRFST